MNELRFLKVISKIDEDLLKEAEVDIEKLYHSKPSVAKRRIYAFGAAAAAIVITVGSVALCSSHDISDMPVDHSTVQQDIAGKSDDGSDNKSVTFTADNDDPAEKATAHTTGSAQNDNESNNKGVSSDTDYNEPAASQTLKEENSQQTNSMDPQGTSVSDDSLVQTTTVKNSSEPSTSTDNKTSQITQPHNNEDKGGVSAEKCYVQPFTATIDSDLDDYGADELHHIDVRTADGSYRQLRLDEYDINGISSTISISDLGGYIGRIVEVSDHDYHGNQAESQEPAIAGADVYYYAPAGNNKMFIIVKKDDQCSVFISDNINVSSGFHNGLAFFDVHSADDIQTIEYHADVPDSSGIMITSVQKTITDTHKINAFYELICQLQPEDCSSLPEHTATPQWLVDAWENYKTDPSAPAREDYGITIKLKDGTVLQDINYQPYLGNGYIEGMQELTPEQNTALRALLG